MNASDLDDGNGLPPPTVEASQGTGPWTCLECSGNLEPNNYTGVYDAPANATIGFHSFRVKVTDTNLDSTDWNYFSDILKVQNNPPEVFSEFSYVKAPNTKKTILVNITVPNRKKAIRFNIVVPPFTLYYFISLHAASDSEKNRAIISRLIGTVSPVPWPALLT